MTSHNHHTESEAHHDHHHHHEEDKETITLKVEGMTCSNCAMGITKTLNQKGLENVNTDFSLGEVSFDIAEGQNINEIVDTINNLGYKVLDEKKTQSTKPLLTLDRKFYFSLVFSIPLVAHMILPWSLLHNAIFQLVLCIPVFVIGLIHFGKSAWGSIKSGVANMDVLIFTGSAAAFVYSLAGTLKYYGTPEIDNYLFYETAATIITLVLLGNLLEQKSVRRTTSAIRELTQLQEVTAKKVVTDNGIEKYVQVKFSEIKKGDVLVVNSGDKIPVDGKIIKGNGTIDESMISGESLPVEKKNDDQIIGSTILIDGNLRMVAETVGRETVLSKIIDMVKKAQNQRPEIQKLGDRVSAIFVPIVLAISVLTFAYWFFIADATLEKALMTSIAVLVISCPCAMGLATPTAVMVGLGRAAKNGILIKGGSTMEQLAGIKSIFFDKTGTLTTGDFKLNRIHQMGDVSIAEIKNILYSLEIHSSHPIAKSIAKELEKEAKEIKFAAINEEKGSGIQGKTNDGIVYKACSYVSVKDLVKDDNYTIYLLQDNKPIAGIDMKDEIKDSAGSLIKELNGDNIDTILLSGDKKEKCEETARAVNIKKVYSEQLPQQKLDIIEKTSLKQATAMVGDGINDAPALAKADVGISLSNATQVAIQTAQVILLNKNDLSKVGYAIKLGKHTLITIKQNLFWAFFYNVIAIPIAAAGLLNPMIAALAMAFSDVIVVGNSLRLRKKKLA